jgi:hypothetical protein
VYSQGLIHAQSVIENIDGDVPRRTQVNKDVTPCLQPLCYLQQKVIDQIEPNSKELLPFLWLTRDRIHFQGKSSSSLSFRFPLLVEEVCYQLQCIVLIFTMMP